MADQSFPKGQRLCNKKKIQELFTKGSSVFLYPLKINFFFPEKNGENAGLSAQNPPQILFSVPKKKLKRACDRNLVKRRLREAYRIDREKWLAKRAAAGLPFPSEISIVYVADKPEDFVFLQKKLSGALNRIK